MLLEVEHLQELPGVHAGRADVERLPCFDYSVEGFAGLLDGRVLIEPMDLVKVDVLDAEALQAFIDGGEDVFAGESAVVGRFADGVVDLGGEDEFLSARHELA